MPYSLLTIAFYTEEKNSSISCLQYIKGAIDKLYNIKIIDKYAIPHHFILKLTQMSEEDDIYILALTEITQLNLLSLYDAKSLENDKALQDQTTIYHLLEAAKEGGAVVKLYNFYKGLMISSSAVITHVGKDRFTCKTTLMQQRAIKYEQKVIIHCELFPYDLQSLEILDINFHLQTLEISSM